MAGIQITGLASGLNWQNIVTELVNADRAPETQWKANQTKDQNQISSLATLNTDLTALQTAGDALSTGTAFTACTATVSDPSSGWTAAANAGTNQGQYAVNVSQLASTAYTTGAANVGSAISSTSDVDGVTIGTMNIATAITPGVFTVDGAQVTIAQSDSLSDVFANIAKATNNAVTASYVPGSDTIQLSSSSAITLGANNDTSNFLAATGLYNNSNAAVNGVYTIGSASALGSVGLNATIAQSGLTLPITDVDSSGNGTFSINGVSIKFNPASSVVHTDARYTQVGTVIMTAQTIRETVLANIAAAKLDDARALHQRLRALEPEAATALEKETYPALTQSSIQCGITLPVRWRGPIFNPSGYASEAINFLLPLSERVREFGIFHQNNNYSEKFVAGLKMGERVSLFDLRDRYEQIKGGIVIEHNPANGFELVPDAAYRVGRTMFETDRISPDWVCKCNQMDEIWVPSKFNVETFAASGVERDKLFVMPESVDENEFDPDRREALALPNRAAFNFLAIFEWSRRKGWDVLLSAYFREFSATDDVCLYLRTYLFSKPDGDPSTAIQRLINEHAATLKLGDKPLPRIHIIAEQVPQARLPGLYKAADCLVAPSRGEGWGRPHHEAMFMGLPVIATNWSGNTEFMTRENSYLIDYEMADTTSLEPELRHYRGHRWADPSEKSLREAMRRVQQNPAEARSKGRRARQEMLRGYSRPPVTDLLIARLQEIERKLFTPVCPAVTARASCFSDSLAQPNVLPLPQGEGQGEGERGVRLHSHSP